ncbi:tetratricopeptide repeat protein [Hydrocoleum sp. CS-953]|uniref:tetratricopeptide repeat protein n=1 Tax=Hydrocoleum sp. CS-953 TaxID=1671698 RepID=UPI000B9A3869|nr:tetratricopeptide repeat protein [Hydrocoleum sp. CS-953]
MIHENRGIIYQQLGDLNKALEYLQKAAELFEQEDKNSESKRLKEVIDKIQRDSEIKSI